MKTKTKRVRSPFALALERLLDETNFFDRTRWASYLRIKPPSISQWVHDKTVPRPDILYMIWHTLDITADVPEEPMQLFAEIARRPASEVSPHGGRMEPTVWDYMTRSSAEEIAGSLRDMTREERRMLVDEGSYAPPRWTSDVDLQRGVTSAKPWVWARVRSETASIDPSLLPRLHPMLPQSQTRPSIDWRDLLAEGSAFIHGIPGSGKTALLGHLLSWVERDPETKAVLLRPVVPAGSESVEPYDLHDHSDGSSLLMIDALDELPAGFREDAVAEIAAFADANPAVRLVVTSRPAEDIVNGMSYLPTYSLASLTQRQVTLWLHQVLGEDYQTRIELDDYLAQLIERDELVQVFKRPLFLLTAGLLFKNYRTTPFADAEIVLKYIDFVLGEWDRRKNIVRTREPWASPKRLTGVLGALSYELAKRESCSFATADFESWLPSAAIRHVPAKDILDALSEQSGVIRCHPDGIWEADEYFVNYLAASHAVTSTEDTFRILLDWTSKDRHREVLRLACSITNDATPILRMVLSQEDVTEETRAFTLATVIAQPIQTDAKTMSEACDRIMDWLDPRLEPWELSLPERNEPDQPERLWALRAVTASSPDDAAGAWRILPAIHQARSGPAGEYLTNRLARAGAPVLRSLKESLDIEGKLELTPHHDYRDVRAQIYAP